VPATGSNDFPLLKRHREYLFTFYKLLELEPGYVRKMRMQVRPVLDQKEHMCACNFTRT